jgi:hypothetical protein
VDPARSLCAHWDGVASGEVPRISRDETLAWHDGPVTACVSCATCGASALLELLAWRPADRVRVYAVAAIDAADVALYRRNLERGSCDLARRAQETEALHACAGPVERVIAVDLADGRLCATVARDASWSGPDGDFWARCETPGSDGWFSRLALS